MTENPILSVDWCTVNDGTELLLPYLWRNILDILYEAISFGLQVAELFQATLDIIFSSGLTIECIKNYQLNDFRIDPWRVWAVAVWLNGYVYEFPLPKVTLADDWKERILEPFKTPWPDSENWLYTIDGVKDYGYNFDPPQTYNCVSLFQDQLFVVRVLTIFYLLKTIGARTAFQFIQSALGWLRHRRMKAQLQDVWELVSEIAGRSTDVPEEENLTKIGNRLEMVLHDTGVLKTTIGAKMVIGL